MAAKVTECWRWWCSTLAPVTLMVAMLVAIAGPGSMASANALTGYSCAHIGSNTSTTSASVSLDGYVAHYVGHSTTTTTVPTPSYGLAYPGQLSITKGAHTWRLVLPRGFGSSPVIQLCEVYPSSGVAPALLMGAYTGGAHCCVDTAIYVRRAASGYTLILNENLQSGTPTLAYDPNQGMVPRDLGSMTLLEGADGRFAYEFGCYACTPTPIHYFSIERSRIVDVSAQYGDALGVNAASLWRAVEENMTPHSGYAGLFGALAAWTAEECTIGHGSGAWATVRSLSARGMLSDARYHQAIFVPRGSFIPALHSFLVKNGYCRAVLGTG